MMLHSLYHTQHKISDKAFEINRIDGNNNSNYYYYRIDMLVVTFP